MYWYLEGMGAIVGINPQGCHPATVQSVAGTSGGRPFEVGDDGRIRPWYTIQREKEQYLAAQEEQQQQAQQPQEGEQEAGESEMKQAIQGDAERDKETEQRLNNLLRRVPDDPAFLLKRKMQLEAQKRQYRRPPSSDRSDW